MISLEMFLDYKKKIIIGFISILFFSIVSSFYLQLHHAKQQGAYATGTGFQSGYRDIIVAKFSYGYPLVFSQVDLKNIEIPIEEASKLDDGVNIILIQTFPFIFDVTITAFIFSLLFVILFYFFQRIHKIFHNKKTFWLILVITFILAYYQVYIVELYYKLPLTISSMIDPFMLPLITITRILLSLLPGHWIGLQGYFFLDNLGFTRSATDYIFFILTFITNYIFFLSLKFIMDKVRKRKSTQKTN